MSAYRTGERLRTLRRAVLVALQPVEGPAPPRCPECSGSLLAHSIGCPVWDALYGPEAE